MNNDALRRRLARLVIDYERAYIAGHETLAEELLVEINSLMSPLPRITRSGRFGPDRLDADSDFDRNYLSLERRYRDLQATIGDIEAFVDRMSIRSSNQVEEILKLQNLNEELNDQVTYLETELDTVRRSATEQESRPTADHLRTIDRLMKENREMKADINRWKSMAVRWSNLGTTKKFEAMVDELEAISDVLGWLKSRLGEFNVYFRDEEENGDDNGEEPLWRDNAR